MTDTTPERIWATHPQIGQFYAETPVNAEDHRFLAEYIRADIHQAALARAEAAEAEVAQAMVAEAEARGMAEALARAADFIEHEASFMSQHMMAQAIRALAQEGESND